MRERGSTRREASYIVMEYVPGGDLKALIDRRGSLSGGELLRLSEAAAGLTHAHERGVIHRDVKPHNILLDENGRPKISDFGIARALDATYATRTGSYLGTALYSPEQLKEKVTPKSDVYSLGATLYHAATGQPPFVGAPIEIAPARLQGADSAPRAQRRGEPGAGGPDPRLHERTPTPARAPTRCGWVCWRPDAASTPPKSIPSPGDGPTRTESAGPTAAPRRGTAQVRPVAQGGDVGTAGRILVALAVVAVLAVIGALAVPRLIGGGNEQAGGEPRRTTRDRIRPEEGRTRRQEAVASRPPRSQRRLRQGRREEIRHRRAAVPARRKPPRGRCRSSTPRRPQGITTGQPSFSARAGGRTFPNRATFEGTFDKVESVEFIEGPTAEVSGDTATVTGRTRATLTDRVEQNEGTWSLVKENGEWKIDGWTVNIDSRPA